MTLSPVDFDNDDLDQFADYLGLKGVDGDMFYESYYKLNVNDEWTEDEYRQEDKYSNY